MKNILKELRSFLLLWGTQTLSSLGTAMTEYALTLWVYQQQGTASSVTMLTLCIFLPTILFRFLAGAVVHRWGGAGVGGGSRVGGDECVGSVPGGW